MAGACGATVHLHYCMGEYVNASLIEHDEHQCGKCGMKKPVQKKGCCHDEHKTFKSAEHHSAASVLDVVHQPVALLPQSFYTFLSLPTINSSTRCATPIHAPPLIITACPIYLKFRNLRI
jgi:hypothetical protein